MSDVEGGGYGGVAFKCDRSVHQGSCGGIVVSSIMKLFTIHHTFCTKDRSFQQR